MSDSELEQLKIKVSPILKKYGVIRAGVFGSYARGEATKKSDIDFLMKFPRGTSLFDVGGVMVDLKKELGHEIDIASEGYLKKRIVPYVEKDLINIYGKNIGLLAKNCL